MNAIRCLATLLTVYFVLHSKQRSSVHFNHLVTFSLLFQSVEEDLD